MMTLRRALAAASLAVALAACSSALPSDSGDMSVAGRVPLYHRPVAATCPAQRKAYDGCKGQMLAPDGGMPFGNQCLLDADCTAGPGTNGRCVGSRVGCMCSYDTCATDGDCAGGMACDCRDTTYTSYGHASHCVASNCRVDADCEGGSGYCSPTLDPSCGSFTGVVGWYCHTKADECVDDRDCTGSDGGPSTPGYCAYRPEVGHWTCSYSICVG